MEPIDRRDFVAAAGGALALAALGGRAPAAEAVGFSPDAGADPAEALNLRFRALYAANRTELGRAVPLAAVTFIGTGVIHRIEPGQVTKAYEPPAWLPRITLKPDRIETSFWIGASAFSSTGRS